MTLAERIVDAVLADLAGRQGILDGIEEDIVQEMRAGLVVVVQAQLRSQEPQP